MLSLTHKKVLAKFVELGNLEICGNWIPNIEEQCYSAEKIVQLKTCTALKVQISQLSSKMT